MIAIQDGRDFYVFNESSDDQPIEVQTYPFPVLDQDMKRAKRARQWFKRNNPEIEIQ